MRPRWLRIAAFTWFAVAAFSWLAVKILPAQPVPHSVALELSELRSEWARDLHAKHLAEILNLYAPDAVFLAPDGSRVTGQVAIRDLMKSVMSAVTSDLLFRNINAESDGKLAYDSGDYRETLTPVAGGPAKELHGSYLMVLKRQADGKWRIVQQVWTLAGADANPIAVGK